MPERQVRGEKLSNIWISIELAGISAGFIFRGNAGFAAEIKKRYRNFRGRRKPDFLLEVLFRNRKQSPYRPAVSVKGHIVRLKRGDFDCVLDAGTGLGSLECRPAQQSFDSFLRVFYSWALLRKGGMLLHSAGILKNGKAHLFLGRSGAGKSTLARLAAGRHASRPPGCSVISDEMNLVRFERGAFRVYGSPFWGEMRNEGRRGSWPLGGVFVIKKAKANRLAALPSGEALRGLLRCLVNFSKGREEAALIMENSARLLSKTGFSCLEFSKRQHADFLNFV